MKLSIIKAMYRFLVIEDYRNIHLDSIDSEYITLCGEPYSEESLLADPIQAINVEQARDLANDIAKNNNVCGRCVGRLFSDGL